MAVREGGVTAEGARPYPYAVGDRITYILPGLPAEPLTGRITHVVANGAWVTYLNGEIKVFWDDILGHADETRPEP